MANFAARPSRGTLQPAQSQSTVVSFVPGQLGKFKADLPLKVAGGLHSVVLRVTGTATTVGEKKKLVGGPDKLPKDFVPTFNFVKSVPPPGASGVLGAAGETGGLGGGGGGTQNFVREKPWDSVDLMTSCSWDDQHQVEGTMSHLTYSVQELERHAAHREEYVDFLRDSRKHRETGEKKREQAKRNTLAKRDLTDPFGLELGMARGPTEPIPPRPPADDELWLADAGGSGRGGARLAPDENRLVHKKFKPRPSTQAEVRDCAAELSSQDLLAVVASHKVLDFGRVCVSSVSSKNFSVANDLSRTVLCSLGRLEPELAASTPPSQVIPSGATAGFDITFECSTVMSFKKIVQYVNYYCCCCCCCCCYYYY